MRKRTLRRGSHGHREGRINRCGNIIVRYTLIEMVWHLIRWQPDYSPIKKLRNALLSKRGKRRLIVAAARRLAIDLWRLATGRATAQELGLQLSNPTSQKNDPLNLGTNNRFGSGACTSSQLGR